MNLMSLGWKEAVGPRVFGPGQGFEMYCKTQVLKLESESESPGLAQRLLTWFLPNTAEGDLPSSP